ncbi:hypothetical protein G6F56_002106 [Rhizopus delemar]|uniref:Methyltransferase type 11 domain-containing protein n=1 Tax=Rhizopus stolonifer TaxID=4846 RepID=A0A367KQF3_RHIST|nr:hypothetical protein G6F56_002106 [Rhizopus delemar]RCI04401.1 hypothetical protein CU098_008109 [Rhizopus stolonifer]
MGNSQSDTRSRFSHKQPLPKHLRPLTPKKQGKLKKGTPVPSKEQPEEEFLFRHILPQSQQDVEFIGSGPRGAFQWLKGRRYMNHESHSILPNDSIELDRARVQSFILRWVYGGDIIAPLQEQLEQGIQVLNVGSGPGMWVGHHMIDLALDYRQSQFVAVDVCDLLPDDFELEGEHLETSTCISTHLGFTPIHPNLSSKLQDRAAPLLTSFTESLLSGSTTTSVSLEEQHKESTNFVPSRRSLFKNLEFHQVNVKKEKLPFPDNQFDVVKQRLSTASLTKEHWKTILLEMIRVTKPGGYIELLEIDHSTRDLGPKAKQLESEMIEATRKVNYEPRMAIYLEDLLKAAGLAEVTTKSVSIPLGEWGLDLGILWKHNMEGFADSTSPLLSKMLGLSVAEYNERWRDFLQECKDLKPFTNTHAAWARKPDNYTGNVDWTLCPPFNNK